MRPLPRQAYFPRDRPYPHVQKNDSRSYLVPNWLNLSPTMERKREPRPSFSKPGIHWASFPVSGRNGGDAMKDVETGDSQSTMTDAGRGGSDSGPKSQPRGLNHAQRRARWRFLGSRDWNGRFSTGVGGAAGGRPVSPQMVADAEWVAGIKLTEPQREAVVNAFKFAREDLAHVRPIELDNSLLPGLRFAPFASPASLPIRVVTRSRQLRQQAPNRFHGLTPTRIWRSVPFGSSGNCCAIDRFRRWN